MPGTDQNGPLMAGSGDASDEQKREGLRAQVRADHPEGAGDDRTGDFRERAESMGIGRSDDHDVDAETDIAPAAERPGGVGAGD